MEIYALATGDFSYATCSLFSPPIFIFYLLRYLPTANCRFASSHLQHAHLGLCVQSYPLFIILPRRELSAGHHCATGTCYRRSKPCVRCYSSFLYFLRNALVGTCRCAMSTGYQRTMPYAWCRYFFLLSHCDPAQDRSTSFQCIMKQQSLPIHPLNQNRQEPTKSVAVTLRVNPPDERSSPTRAYARTSTQHSRHPTGVARVFYSIPIQYGVRSSFATPTEYRFDAV